MTEPDFLAAAKSNMKPAGQPCSVGSLIMRLRQERPFVAERFEAALAIDTLTAQAITDTMPAFDLEPLPPERLNHHRKGRCRNCPAKGTAA